MVRSLVCLAFLGMLVLVPGAGRAATTDAAVNVQIDTTEPQAALAIMAKLRRSQPVTAQDWNALFATRGYELLKKRQADFHRPFSDDSFKAFISDPKTLATYQQLSDTLATWISSDIVMLAHRAFVYLPAGSKLHATVYPLIKPATNSYVYQLDTDPAIMLFLDPTLTKDQFGNTVSHELYHIGDSQNCPSAPIAAQEAKYPQMQRDFLNWLSAFGEGSAMLAAAGGPDVHPHWEDPQSDKDVWDKAMSNYTTDFRSLQTFFADIADGTLKGDTIDKQGYTFFGDVQGPWYTVGYKMNVLIEHTFGRAKLIDAICDKRSYLATYNEAAMKNNAAGNPPLPLWSSQLTSLFQK